MVLAIRTLLLYIIVIASLRVMGKRQLGELQPSELVVAIMISDLASIPMQSVEIPLLSGIVPVLTLLIAEVVTSQLSLKSRAARKFLSGEPSIVIYGGNINEREMRRQRFNLNDLLEELRLAGCNDISDVEVAVIETSGKLSVIPKDKARPATVEDITSKKIRHDGLPCVVISDGKVNQYELRRAKKDLKWLKNELKKQKVNSVEEVFIASLDAEDELFVQKKEGKQ